MAPPAGFRLPCRDKPGRRWALEKTVVVFQGKSDFDSVNVMAAELAQGFAALGWRPRLVDLRHPDCLAQIVAELRGGGVELFLSLNGFGIPNGESIGFYAHSPAKVLVYFVDHPLYHYPTIRARLPHLTATFPTRHHVDFCADFIRGDIPLSHVPHGGGLPAAGVVRPWRDRDVDVLLPASLPEPPAVLRSAWSEEFGPAVAGRLGAIVEEQQADPARPLHHSVQRVLGDAAVEAMFPYFATADKYLRAKVKFDTVAALVQC
ncbi:MAG: hypothetical protein K2X44_09745, partial [Magnetospirillum sp.]|nr:hypothetical protein [Magnetospirillum sp.]